MTHGNIPPGWYDDGQGAQRYWDGARWTEHTQPAAGSAPAEPAAPAEAPVDLSSEPTRLGPPPTGAAPEPGASATPADGINLDKGAGSTPPSTPSGSQADVTMIAPAGSFGQTPGQAPGQAPGQPQQYGQPQQPAYGQPQYGQPQQPAYGQPGGAPAWQSQYPTGGSGSGGGKGKLFAIIGGAAALVVIGIVLLLVVLGGSGGPKGVAEDYIEAQTELDFEKACELTAEDQQQESLDALDVDDCGAFADQADDQFPGEFRGFIEDLEFDVEIGDVEEDGDKATVDYEITSKYEGDDEDGFKEAFGTEELEETEEDSLELVKEDGDWKVAETIQ